MRTSVRSVTARGSNYVILLTGGCEDSNYVVDCRLWGQVWGVWRPGAVIMLYCWPQAVRTVIMLLTAGCEDKCEECDGPGLCTRCFPPFLQSAGHCVQSCPERSFTDNANNCRREWCFVCLLVSFVLLLLMLLRRHCFRGSGPLNSL